VIFDGDVLTVDETGLLEALLECGMGGIPLRAGRNGVDICHHWHRRLLRVRRQRPRRRAAEKRDEVAPLQLIELHLVPQL
jgi:hypothetical protein